MALVWKLQFIILISVHQDYKFISYRASYELYMKPIKKSCHIKKKKHKQTKNMEIKKYDSSIANLSLHMFIMKQD